jgi:mannose-6-phosphate isomerase-like protein (cupin superfamily)
MEQLEDLKSILSRLDKLGPSNYFIDFMQNDSFEAGILRLFPKQKDTQNTHSADEFYFVVKGSGNIRISQKDYIISEGACIFVPAKTSHYFHGNEEELIVLYIFRS